MFYNYDSNCLNALFLELANSSIADAKRILSKKYNIFLEFKMIEVTSMIISQDNSYIVAGSADCIIRIWNILKLAQEYELTGHLSVIKSLCLTNDDSLLFSSSSQLIIVWNFYTKQQLYKLENYDMFYPYLSRDSKYLILRKNNFISFYDIKKMDIKFAIYDYSFQFNFMFFTYDNKYVVLQTIDNSLVLFELSSNKIFAFFEDKKNYEYSSIHGNEKIIAAVRNEVEIAIWNIQTRELEHILIGHNEIIFNLKITVDSMHILSGGDDGLRLWNLQTFKEILYLSDKPYTVLDIAYTKDYKYIIAAGEDYISVWDCDTNTKKILWHQRHYYIQMIEITDNDRYLISGSCHIIHIWDIQNNFEELSFLCHQGEVSALSMIQNTQFVITGGDDCTIRLWDISLRRQIDKIIGHKSSIQSISYNKNRNLIITCDNKNTMVWKIKALFNK